METEQPQDGKPEEDKPAPAPGVKFVLYINPNDLSTVHKADEIKLMLSDKIQPGRFMMLMKGFQIDGPITQE